MSRSTDAELKRYRNVLKLLEQKAAAGEEGFGYMVDVNDVVAAMHGEKPISVQSLSDVAAVSE